MYRKLFLTITIFLVLVFSGTQIRLASAQTNCTNELQEEANRYLSLARIFELQGEWQKAADYFERAALSPCTDPALEGSDGLNRVLSNQNGWINRYIDDLKNLSLALGIYTIQFAGLIFLALIIIKLVIWRISRDKQWMIMPFEDYTGNNQGEAIAGAMVSSIHNIRLLHSDKPVGLIGPSENVDMPSITGMSYRDNLLSALNTFNSLEVSGMGLPIGSMISSAVHWLNLGRPRLHGSIRKNGDRMEIILRREEGRQGHWTKVWRVSEIIDQDDDEPAILNKLTEQLCFRVIHEAIPDSWGTSSYEALRSYTDGLLSLHRFYDSCSRDLIALDEARSAFRSALSIDSTYALASYHLALVELNDGNSELATKLFKSLLSVADQQYRAEIFYNLGVAYYHWTRDWAYDRAEEAFNSVVRIYRENPPEIRNRAILALTYCGRIAIAAQKAHLDRRAADRFYQAGQQDYLKVIDLINEKKVRQRFPARQNGLDLSSKKMIEAQAKYSLAILNLHCKYFEPARSLLEETIALNPYHWRAYTALGQLEMEQNRPQEAVPALQKATDLSPRYEFAHYLLGRAHTSLGETEAAITEFSKAPGNARAHDEWGRLLAMKGDYQAAIERFEQAVRLNSQLADAYANIAWYLAEGEMLLGDGLKRAEQVAKRAIDLSKDQPSYWHKLAVLGHVYYFGGKIDAAEVILNQALQENPVSAQVYYYLALTDVARGDDRAAREKLISLFRIKDKGIWHDKASRLMKELKEKLNRASQTEPQRIQAEPTNDQASSNG